MFELESKTSDRTLRRRPLSTSLSHSVEQAQPEPSRHPTAKKIAVLGDDGAKALQRENEYLRKENEILKKENESLKAKSELLVKQDESLKEQLSKKVVCPICGKLYSRSDALYLHLQSGDERHRTHALDRYGTRCEVCSREFKRWGDLRKHMVKHEPKIPGAADVDTEDNDGKVAAKHLSNQSSDNSNPSHKDTKTPSDRSSVAEVELASIERNIEIETHLAPAGRRSRAEANIPTEHPSGVTSG